MREAEDLIRRAKRYLDSARILHDAGDYESRVSRSYDAMFHAAEAALLTKGLVFSSHAGVKSAFGAHFVKTGDLPRELGKDLTYAFEKRQLSDYEFTFVIRREEAEELIERARAFVARIEDHLRLGGATS